MGAGDIHRDATERARERCKRSASQICREVGMYRGKAVSGLFESLKSRHKDQMIRHKCS